MLLATKPLLIAVVGAVSVVGVAAAWRSYQASQVQTVQQTDKHLLEGAAPPEKESVDHPQPPQVPQDISSQFIILNADEYRPEMVEIDRLVFDAQAFTPERRATLAEKLESLGQLMKSKNNSRFIAMEAEELRQLGDLVKSQGPNAVRTTVEHHWMRIRNNVFDDRSWFARSAADLEQAGANAPQLSERRVDPFIPDDPATVASKQALEGRWKVKGMFASGKPTHDSEMANSLWMFTRNHLYISAQDGSVSHFTLTESNGALHLEPDPSNAGPHEKGWMNYEFNGPDLKVAFYDGLRERPEGFTPPPDKHEPLFIVVLLQRVQ
jgi:uncharacterized protein (TIGR03067 family)